DLVTQFPDSVRLARRLGARLEPGEDAGGDRPRLVLRDAARVGHYPDDGSALSRRRSNSEASFCAAASCSSRRAILRFCSASCCLAGLRGRSAMVPPPVACPLRFVFKKTLLSPSAPGAPR